MCVCVCVCVCVLSVGATDRSGGNDGARPSVGLVRAFPLFFVPAKMPLSSYPGIWLPNSVPSRLPAALTAATAATQGGLGGEQSADVAASSLPAGTLVQCSARLRNALAPRSLSRKASRQAFQRVVQLDPVEVRAACGVGVVGCGRGCVCASVRVCVLGCVRVRVRVGAW